MAMLWVRIWRICVSAYLRVAAYLRSARMCCLPWRGAVFAIWYPNECPGSVWSRPALRISIDDIYVLPSLKYRRYCGIIVLKPKILYNIVWTFNKISLTGDQDKHHQKINCTFEAQSNIFKGCQYHIWNRNTKKNERTSNIYVQFILCVNICTSSTDVQLNLVVNILYCWANKLSYPPRSLTPSPLARLDMTLETQIFGRGRERGWGSRGLGICDLQHQFKRVQTE